MSPLPDDASEYFILERENPRGMLLYSLPDPNDDESWTLGQRFKAAPDEPLEIEIVTGYESAQALHWFSATPVVSNALLEVLRRAGVSNVDAYDAVLVSEDRRTRLEGYKAINILGLLSAADARGTRYAPENPSRYLDASIDSLKLDPARTQGALMFRLAQASGSVVVHRRVKEAIEAANLPWISFILPADLVT
ncbi:imm11 family protein [Pyxidicoccus sp. 3LFB2]